MATEPKRFAVVDNDILTVPVTDEVQKILEQWINDHYVELRARLTPLGAQDILIVQQRFYRYVQEGEVRHV